MAAKGVVGWPALGGGDAQPRVSPILMLVTCRESKREKNYEFLIKISAHSCLNTLSCRDNVQLQSYHLIQWSRSNLDGMG